MFYRLFLFPYQKLPFYLKSNAISQDCHTHSKPSTGGQEDCKLQTSLENTVKHRLKFQPDDPPINLPNSIEIKNQLKAVLPSSGNRMTLTPRFPRHFPEKEAVQYNCKGHWEIPGIPAFRFPLK